MRKFVAAKKHTNTHNSRMNPLWRRNSIRHDSAETGTKVNVQCTMLNGALLIDSLRALHPLVASDPKRAQEIIVEMTALMHYAARMTGEQRILLYYELDSICHLAQLMKLNYGGKVRISLQLPEVGDHWIQPPAMLFAYVESAFRHCIEGEGESFVEIKATVEGDELRFLCRNSKGREGQAGAVSAVPIRTGKSRTCIDKQQKQSTTRFSTLRTEDSPDVYSVELTIPLE